MIEYNIDKCISEFLAFQHVQTNTGWKLGIKNRIYDEFIECPRSYKVTNGQEANCIIKNLSNTVTINYTPNQIGILISSGIDSATVAKTLPKYSKAIYATYKERDYDPEIERVKQYCAVNDLDLYIVEVSWKDYEEHIDYLMKVKNNPIHPCEIPVYLCCLKAKELGVKVLFSGWGADTHFGGMDKLLSKDWTLSEFKNRYEYCPRINENDSHLDNIYNDFLIDNSDKIDMHKFLTFNYHLMTLKSFFYLPELVGLVHIPLWGHIGLSGDLDINRIRNGEPKYIISETYNLMYQDDNLEVTQKIPFTRPTDIYMNDHFDDFKYHNKLQDYINSNKLSSQQKWMVYVLNRFLLNIN